MSKTIELELSYLASSLPEDLAVHKYTELEDIYFPADQPHPRTRIRRKGDTYEFTKKTLLDPSDASQQQEQTIELTRQEYEALATADGRRLTKDRYMYPYQGRTAEIDIFKGALKGLVVIEFEFDTLKEKDGFRQPDFCLADVSQEEFIAGGVLAGKSYQAIHDDLARFGYRSLALTIENAHQ